MRRRRAVVVAVVASALWCTTLAAPAQAQTPAPSPSPGPGPPPPYIETNPERVSSGSASDVLVRQGGQEGRVELYAADRGTGAFSLIRTGQFVNGSATFRIYPDRHKTLYARSEQGANGGRSNYIDLAVSAAVSISATRHGARTYTFYGRARPALGPLAVSLYRVDAATGRPVVTARTATASDGTYSLRRTFTGSGRHAFFTSVSATEAADQGSSSHRSTLIY